MRRSAATKPLRERLGLAIFKAFEADYQAHGTNFDPDTCYRAADEVIALLVGELVNDTVTAKFHPSIIGPAEFVFAGEER